MAAMGAMDRRAWLDGLTDEQRRVVKRSTTVLAIRATDEYVWVAENMPHRMPGEPDPLDAAISKRTWETSVQAWRATLRRVQHDGL